MTLTNKKSVNAITLQFKVSNAWVGLARYQGQVLKCSNLNWSVMLVSFRPNPGYEVASEFATTPIRWTSLDIKVDTKSGSMRSAIETDTGFGNRRSRWKANKIDSKYASLRRYNKEKATKSSDGFVCHPRRKEAIDLELTKTSCPNTVSVCIVKSRRTVCLSVLGNFEDGQDVGR